MKENLGSSLELVFGHEGGYVNVATDKGGPTKYGITHKTLAAHRGVQSVTADQVRGMTITEAEDIYRKSYWGPAGGDVLPSGLDYAAFDTGVMSGPGKAVKLLQQTLKATGKYTGVIDGWIGEGTLAAVKSYPGGVATLIRDYCEERMKYLRSLKSKKTGFPVNGRGWTIRVTGIDPQGLYKPVPGVLGNALTMAKKQVPVVDSLPAGVADTSGAKAEPSKPNPWVKPEVVLPAVGAVGTAAGGVAPSVLGSNYLQIAISFGIVVVVLIGAYYAFRRIQKAA